MSKLKKLWFGLTAVLAVLLCVVGCRNDGCL